MGEVLEVRALPEAVRWLLSGNGMKRPQAYFGEQAARRRAAAVWAAVGIEVVVTRQEYRGGHWVDADGE